MQNPYHYGEKLLKTAWILSDADAAWDWPGCEGGGAVVEVYAPGDEAELLLNGRSLGRRPLERCRALFDTVYEPGTLEAVAYRGGAELGRYTLRTPGPERQLRLEKEEEGGELIFLKAAITDAAGEPVISADELLVAEAEGAQLLGFGSGDPKPLLNYNEGRCKTWKGRAQLILRKNGTGPIRVRLSSDSGLRAVWEQA